MTALQPATPSTRLAEPQSHAVEDALAAAVAANLAAADHNDAPASYLVSSPDARTGSTGTFNAASTTANTGAGTTAPTAPGAALTSGRASKPRAHKSPGSGAKRTEPAKRKFICSFSPYGCDVVLGSKNEWKRHVAIQHLQLGFYRCDVGSCNPDLNAPSAKKVYNDFNRKDLFTQHHRRMHRPPHLEGTGAVAGAETSADWRAFEDGLEEVRNRCWLERRRPPMRSTCGFCGRTYEGDGSWNDRMEHVGGHYSRELPENVTEEREDPGLTEWALENNVVKVSARGDLIMVDQTQTSNGNDKVMRPTGDEVEMANTNGDAVEVVDHGYAPTNGTERPGSSDRLEDLINKLINPKKPRMTKRLQWKCDCGLDCSCDFDESLPEDDRAFRALGKISIVCKNSQSPFMHTGPKGQFVIIRCSELADEIAREGKTFVDHNAMVEGEGMEVEKVHREVDG